MTFSFTLHVPVPAGSHVRLCDADLATVSEMTVELDSSSITMYGCPDVGPNDHVVVIVDPPPSARLRTAANAASRQAGRNALRLLADLAADLREAVAACARLDPQDLLDRLTDKIEQVPADDLLHWTFGVDPDGDFVVADCDNCGMRLLPTNGRVSEFVASMQAHECPAGVA